MREHNVSEISVMKEFNILTHASEVKQRNSDMKKNNNEESKWQGRELNVI